MLRIEKTVFISYRRTNTPWALAVYKDLTQRGYDVFFDFSGIASGDFERVILENIKARAHFLVLLTPSALERCGDAGDWLRREIETALEHKRNIVPLMLEGLISGTPGIANQLTGTLAPLKQYNALRVPVEYFDEAMARLCQKHLNVPLEAVLHPVSTFARQVVTEQKVAASTAPAVTEKELTAQEWFERGLKATDLAEKIRAYSEAIRLQPDYADAFVGRGFARAHQGDREGAIKDFTESIRLQPNYADAFYIRGVLRADQGDTAGAIQDYSEAIRLKPDDADAFYNRGFARKGGDTTGAIQDYNEAIRLKPDYALAFNNRGVARRAQGDITGAIQDYSEAIRLQPDDAAAFYNRALIYRNQAKHKAAVSDLQKYLDYGGGMRDGDQAEVEQMIRDLKAKL